MRNKILGVALCTAGMLSLASCSDYLETSSPSTVTADVAMSSLDNCQSSLTGTYTGLHSVLLNQTFGAGLYYALDVAGSDIERHPGDEQPTRWEPETFYKGGNASILAAYNPVTYGKEAPNSAFALLYSVISTTNVITNGITESQLSGESGKEFHRILAEAYCMKATCYRELIKYYGDVPFAKDQTLVDKISSRLEIYDQMIKDLQENVEYLDDITSDNKTRFTKQYGYALIGRIALEAAGYQTYRLDITDVSKLEKHPDYTDDQNATYARPKNYKEYYDKAYEAFRYVAENPGAIKFDNSDYSKFFTQLHGADNTYADESIFEDEQIQGGSLNCERPYAFGRPAKGNGSNAFPCKSYGQTRINPAFYYGMFDPKDKRRDLSVAVTVSNGDGTEVLTTMAPGNCLNGGLACNKYDENRQSTVYTAKQRKSGINIPYMRVSEVYLGLAEALAALGKNSEAAEYYNKTHVRAGLPSASSVTVEEVIDERGFEYAGEGDRRFTLIRTGFIGKKIKAIKELTAAMISGLKNNGYYTFSNGNTISNSIYVKMVNPRAEGLSSRLTPATPSSMLTAGYEPTNDKEAIQFPGWRGQHDWENVSGFTDYGSNPKSNLAIHGLFSKLTEAKVSELKDNGYIEYPWGSVIAGQESFYSTGIFEGWNFKSAPIYLFPFTTNALIGGFTNGYGFSSSF